MNEHLELTGFMDDQTAGRPQARGREKLERIVVLGRRSRQQPLPQAAWSFR